MMPKTTGKDRGREKRASKGVALSCRPRRRNWLRWCVGFSLLLLLWFYCLQSCTACGGSSLGLQRRPLSSSACSVHSSVGVWGQWSISTGLWWVGCQSFLFLVSLLFEHVCHGSLPILISSREQGEGSHMKFRFFLTTDKRKKFWVKIWTQGLPEPH